MRSRLSVDPLQRHLITRGEHSGYHTSKCSNNSAAIIHLRSACSVYYKTSGLFLLVTYRLALYFQRIVMACPESLQLSIVLCMSSRRSFGGKPAMSTNSLPPFASSFDCCHDNITQVRERKGYGIKAYAHTVP